MRGILTDAALLFLAGSLGLFADVPAPVPPPVQLFDLDQVRLLDGPFKVAQETDEAYLLKLDPDRFLAWFRKEAGLTPKGEVYGGWESKGVAGEDCGHYMSALAQMYAATGNEEFKRRADYIVDEFAACQKANGGGYVAAIPGGKEAFARIKAGDVGMKGLWVPWYTIHKELAGLLDVYHYCHNDEALEVAKGLADWIDDDVGGLSHDQMQQMLTQEQGGITEALANLYGITGEQKYLDVAEKFRHDKIFLPFVDGKDILDGWHANTQIPKFIGYQRVYELTGDTQWDAAAENFWKAVSGTRSWVIGGNSEREFFFPVDKFEQQMTDVVGPESCNSYNMLKLTEHIFQYHPDAPVMDFYERALFNHILSSVRPNQDGFVYYSPMSPGSYRTYSTDFNDFWCCVGTGMENHAKYGKMIYAKAGTDKLYVNLFIASTLDWKEAGLQVEQKTGFPEEEGSSLVFHSSAPKEMEVDVRYPAWVAAGALKISVNGQPQTISAQPGEFASVKREWKEGDTLRVETPMALHTEMLPHSSDYVSILYGPLVLAGKLGFQGLTPEDFYGQAMNEHKKLKPTQNPVIVQPVSDVLAHIKPADGQPLTFISDGLIKPRDVRMVPFYKLYNERYTVYWQVLDSGSWQKLEAQAEADEATDQQLLEATVDDVRPHEQQPEVDHQLASEQSNSGISDVGGWRDAHDGGWFSYTMKVDATQPLELACQYWGDDKGDRTFDVSLDGTVIATEARAEAHPGQLYYVAYPVPPALIQGKQAVTVRFQSKAHSIAGGLFDCRMVKAGALANAAPKSPFN